MTNPPIQWYPGHIAKAERQLKEKLKSVDVVLEVLDARVAIASQHPQVPAWIGSKPRILVVVRFVLGEIAGESPHINLGLV